MAEVVVLSAEKIDEIIDYLQGTCKSFDEAVKLIADVDCSNLSIDSLSEIDQHIFLCDECGWWHDTSESNDYYGDNLCDSCLDDRVDEEDSDTLHCGCCRCCGCDCGDYDEEDE